MDEFDKQAREALFFTVESELDVAQQAVVNRVASVLRTADRASHERIHALRHVLIAIGNDSCGDPAWAAQAAIERDTSQRECMACHGYGYTSSHPEAAPCDCGVAAFDAVSAARGRQPNENSLHYRIADVLGMVDHEECGPRFLIASEDELVKKVKELTDDHWSLKGREISGEKRFIVVSEREAREEIGNEAVDAWGDRDDSWLLIDRHKRCVVGADGGEPEDQLLVRDWSWVAEALNAVHAEHEPTDLQKALIHMGGVLEERERIAKALIERAEHFEKPVMSYVAGERRFAAQVLRSQATLLRVPDKT